jgi:hypothetical protein|tara:strand:+ start:9022 stop:9234 length:213 start_codon:yes stop_codon:yes gene_type:complete
MMTRKHFVIITKAIRECLEDDANKFTLVTTLADKFQEENPRFDRARFIRATNRAKPAGEGQPSEQRAKIA